MNKTALILGARSGIGKALAMKFAMEGWQLYLASRDIEGLRLVEEDISKSYKINVRCFACDITVNDAGTTLLQSLPSLPEVMICTAGYLGDSVGSLTQTDEAEKIMRTNFSACVSFIQTFANAFAQRGSGTIIGISSVAGERGKSTNMIYSAAKAGLTAYLDGLRNMLYHQGVLVITVKPGYVNTPMTAALKLPASMTTSPEALAIRIYSAMLKQKSVIYSSCKWRIATSILKIIPEFIYKKKQWKSR